MDTVVTRLTGAWKDLSATWAAEVPPAVAGEVVTVQPADQGASHAIEVIQAVAAPAAGARGHLLAGCDTLALTTAAGRKHWGRAYMGRARVVATGAGIAGEGAGAGSSGGGGPGLTDAQIGDKAFSNPPPDLSAAEKTAVRTAVDAQKASRRTISFSGQDGSSSSAYLDPMAPDDEFASVIGFYNGSTLIANSLNPPNPDINTATRIRLPQRAGAAGRTMLGSTLAERSAVDLRPMLGDAVTSGGSVILGLSRAGQTDDLWVRATTVIVSQGWYDLTGLSWVGSLVPASYEIYWRCDLSYTGPYVAADMKGRPPAPTRATIFNVATQWRNGDNEVTPANGSINLAIRSGTDRYAWEDFEQIEVKVARGSSSSQVDDVNLQLFYTLHLAATGDRIGGFFWGPRGIERRGASSFLLWNGDGVGSWQGARLLEIVGINR